MDINEMLDEMLIEFEAAADVALTKAEISPRIRTRAFLAAIEMADTILVDGEIGEIKRHVLTTTHRLLSDGVKDVASASAPTGWMYRTLKLLVAASVDHRDMDIRELLTSYCLLSSAEVDELLG